MKRFAALFTLVLGLTGLWAGTAGASTTAQQKILTNAQFVLEEIISAPDTGIPSKLISKAKAIIIIPTMFKGGFFFGARYGSGVVAVRDAATGKWGPPAFVTTYGGSFGLQFGAQAVDLVLLLMSERGVNALLNNKFTVGGDLAVSVGPVGRYAEAGTDVQFQGEVYSYSRSKGAFAGVSLKGTVFQPDDAFTREYYRTDLSAKQILFFSGISRVPKSSAVFMNNLNRLAPPSPQVLTKLQRSERRSTPPVQKKKPVTLTPNPQAPGPAPQEKPFDPGERELIRKSEAPLTNQQATETPTRTPLW